MLKESGYQESFISKIFKRITNNYSLSRSQQQMQAKDTQGEEIKIMSINLPLIENATENLRPILRSHKTRSTFFTENTGVNYSVNQIVAIEDKNNILCQIDCNKCRAAYFGESKRPLKSRPNELKRSAKNCDCDKSELQIIAWEQIITSWDQKKVANGESRLILRYIKETVHSLKNPHQNNKISYILPKYDFLIYGSTPVTYLFHTSRF